MKDPPWAVVAKPTIFYTLRFAVRTRHRRSRSAGIVEFLLPPQDVATEIDVGEVDKKISFDDFNRSLLKGEVSVPFKDDCAVANFYDKNTVVVIL